MVDVPQLDHTVINTHYQMDQAQDLFRNLGFHLTDRGYHTLGSINHLMMFDTDYIELIGLPEPAEGVTLGRSNLLDAPLGINGLVFKTSDADETFSHLEAIGMAGNPPNSFSRPVDLPGGAEDAHFRTAHLRPGIFPGGRVYFCEHRTPDLVWRPEWQRHDNGALSMPEFVIASTNHETEAQDMARLLRAEMSGANDWLSVKLKDGMISFLSPRAYQDRYGELASSLEQRASIFGAMVVRVRDLADIRAIAATATGISVMDEADRVVIRQQNFDSVLEFVC